MTGDYVDLSTLTGAGEPLLEPIETDDYTPFALTTPGNYISHSRTVKARRNERGLSFEITLTGGVSHPETGRVHNNGKFPLKKWVTTTLFEQDGKPGKTSSAAEYLRACGFNPKEVDLVEAMAESQGIPVKVFVGRTNKAEKLADGSYSEDGGTLKTRDFLKEDGNYAESVTIGSKTYRGKEKVGNFSRI